MNTQVSVSQYFETPNESAPLFFEMSELAQNWRTGRSAKGSLAACFAPFAPLPFELKAQKEVAQYNWRKTGALRLDGFLRRFPNWRTELAQLAHPA